MKKILLLIVVTFVPFWSAQAGAAHIAYAIDALAPNAVETKFVDSGLSIKFEFTDDITGFGQSSLSYAKVKNNNKTQGDSSLAPSSADAHKLQFVIPSTFFSDADSVEYTLTLKKSDGTTQTLAKTSVDVSSNTRLQRILANQPRLVVFTRKLIEADDRIGVEFVTDRPGKIKVSVTGTGSPASQTSSKIDKTHQFIFGSLQSNQTYKFKAEVLKIDNENSVENSVTAAEPDLTGVTFRTTQNGPPNVQSSTPKTSPNNVVLGIKSNQEVYADIAYSLVSEGVEGERVRLTSIICDPVTKGGCGGAQKIAAGSSETAVTVPNLVPGSTYRIFMAFKNKDGVNANLITSDYTVTLPTTPPALVAFDFADALGVEMGPLGLTMKWNATSAPDANSAFMEILFDGDAFKITKQADITGTSMTAQLLDATNLSGLIAKSYELKKEPVFRVKMTKGGIERTRTIQVKFALPTKSQVQASSLAPTAKKELIDVLDNTIQGKSVDWGKLLRSGLSILGKIVL
jgi:hypothetical protein